MKLFVHISAIKSS